MKLRLLFDKKCNRNCPGCCNKGYDLDNLPIELDFKGYELIMITGGEPMMLPARLTRAIESIRRLTLTPIVVYTAKVDDWRATNWILDIVDGLTVTLHNQDDVVPFMVFHTFMNRYKQPKSLRLNVMEGVELPKPLKLGGLWQVKEDIKWQKHCPLPEDEVFHQYTPYMDLD